MQLSSKSGPWDQSPRLLCETFLYCLMAISLIGCSTAPSPNFVNLSDSSAAWSQPLTTDPSATIETSGFETLPQKKTLPRSYKIGPGDGLRVIVVGQSELSGSYRVGPDGAISMALAGTLSLLGKTREESATLVRHALAPYFKNEPAVSVDVDDYQNNKAFVLGRVEVPGEVDLSGGGTLLSAIAQAGGLPVREYRSYLARCAIIRGSEQILWVDLIDLLQGGNLSLNVPLENGDIVFLPDSEDAIVFVMGEVQNPGAVPIKVRLNLIQAIAQSGGFNENADLDALYLIRDVNQGGSTAPVRIDFEQLIEQGDFAQNVELKSGDILYVARTGLGDLNYVMRQVSPALNAILLGGVINK